MEVHFFIPVLLLLCCGVYGLRKERPDFDSDLSAVELKRYLQNGTRSTYLEWVMKQFQDSKLIGLPDKVQDDVPLCVICDLLVDFLIMERQSGMTAVQLAAEVSYFCSMLNIETERVCDGVIEENANVIVYIIDNNENVSGFRICGLILENSGCEVDPDLDWAIDVPAGNTVERPEPGTTSFNIIHVGDIHYDPRYTPNKPSPCDEPLCCQDDQADGADGVSTCGYWSAYQNADVPMHTIEATFKQIQQAHEFKYMYFTGDIIPHRVWETSHESNSKCITDVLDKFSEHFNVTVFPVLGNHEGHPVNTFAPMEVSDEVVSTKWLYDLVSQKWGKWITSTDAELTILKGGYYTISPEKGFRIIVLNNNVCSIENWWLLYDNVDPYDQLKWLVGVLTQAEKDNERVHILAHQPTRSCYKVWSREYYRIVERFASTIAAQFYGHSHTDDFYISYSIADAAQAISTGWNGASVIADKSNPSYKVLQVDEKTFNLVDYEEWYFNLTLANADPSAELAWTKLYSFLDAYSVTSLEPTAMDSLVRKMSADSKLIQNYYKFKYRNSDIMMDRGCDENCEKQILDAIVSTQKGDTAKFTELLKIYEQNKM